MTEFNEEWREPKLVDTKELAVPDLTEDKFVDEIVSEISNVKGTDERFVKFFTLVFLGLPSQEAAVRSGYSPKSAYAMVSRAKHGGHLRDKLERTFSRFPDFYRNFVRAKLPQIAEVEGAALDKYREDPELAIRHVKLLRDMKVAAGALEEESKPSVQLINVELLQAVVRGNVDLAAGRVAMTERGDDDWGERDRLSTDGQPDGSAEAEQMLKDCVKQHHRKQVSVAQRGRPRDRDGRFLPGSVRQQERAMPARSGDREGLLNKIKAKANAEEG